jgi:hypothetical protein
MVAGGAVAAQPQVGHEVPHVLISALRCFGAEGRACVVFA